MSKVLVIVFLAVLMCISLLANIYLLKRVMQKRTPKRVAQKRPFIYRPVSDEQKTRLEDTIKISFTGDLILLKGMVDNARNEQTGAYDFDPMFQYVCEYYDECNLNIGVLEGPVAGKEAGFSNSDFDDGIPIHLNFPKEYAASVKRAGINLVTLANNHLLDKDIEGAYHTLDELDCIGLSHVGAYRNKEEKAIVKMISVCGKKIAVLPYTYGSNFYQPDFFYQPENRHLTHVIVPPNNENYRQCLEDVEHDFEEARKLSPDLIVVLPHMGKQFRHAPDSFQRHWCDVFIKNGADLILSDHPHAVQPIEWVRKKEKNVLIVHCPGNFINSYTDRDGDASMIVQVYLDKTSCKLVAASFIPMYSYCKFGWEKKENYVGLPIYKLLKNPSICPGLSQYEYKRICKVHELVTGIALGSTDSGVRISDVQERYYIFPEA